MDNEPMIGHNQKEKDRPAKNCAPSLYLLFLFYFLTLFIAGGAQARYVNVTNWAPRTSVLLLFYLYRR